MHVPPSQVKELEEAAERMRSEYKVLQEEARAEQDASGARVQRLSQQLAEAVDDADELRQGGSTPRPAPYGTGTVPAFYLRTGAWRGA